MLYVSVAKVEQIPEPPSFIGRERRFLCPGNNFVVGQDMARCYVKTDRETFAGFEFLIAGGIDFSVVFGRS